MIVRGGRVLIVHFIFFILKIVIGVINVQMNQKIQTGREQVKIKINLRENSWQHFLRVLLKGLCVYMFILFISSFFLFVFCFFSFIIFGFLKYICLHICNSTYFPAKKGLTLSMLSDNCQIASPSAV